MPASAPLHARIRAEVEREIMSGGLAPGDRIPFEHELMARHGCSRMTVSKALSALAAAGLIVRRKGAGSFVAAQRVDMAALAIPDLRAEIEGRGAHYTIELLERREHETSLDLVCRHLSNAQPFAIERRTINLDGVPAARDVDFGRVAPGSWLIETVPWTQAENRIFARLAGADAALLAIDAGAPCLALERRTWRDTAPVTHVEQVFPAENFSFIARFAASS